MARFGYIQVIRRCNQRCRFCSNPDTEALLPVAECVALLDDFRARSLGGVLLTGGEPTLHPDLPEVIGHAISRGIAPRVITNGQRLSERAYLATLFDAGLRHVHLSLQSHLADVQAALTGKADSLSRLTKALENLGALGVVTDINTTLNSANAGHLDLTVAWLIERFPWLRHWVFNNLDPTSQRARENPDVIASPIHFELSLFRALKLLASTERTFRVERVPLCYMADFAHCSTETRKMIKSESRRIAFLDERGQVDDSVLRERYGKADACEPCAVSSICAGLFACEVRDFRDTLHPIFISREIVENQV